tara:strand:- start:746 stop:1342 length:597 start_codon:yes stop_codon:yes gene_type:complete
MTKSTRMVQLILLAVGITLLLSVYWLYPKFVKENNKLAIIEKEEPLSETDKKSDIFENVEYRGFYQSENPFIVTAEKAFILSEDDPDSVFMTSMKVTISLRNGETWIILCDKGKYLKTDYDIYCEKNVFATNGKTEVRSGFLNILATNDTASMYENVTINNKEGSILKADFIDYDFQRKKYKVSMYTGNEKVKIKLIK